VNLSHDALDFLPCPGAGILVGGPLARAQQMILAEVTYSYTQISQYLACPRRYRYTSAHK
jgi:hypothetical protein